jgi:deoxyribose-phosphate aldolase
MNYTAEQIAQALDLSVLKPMQTPKDIDEACQVAKEHGIHSICVQPCYVDFAKQRGVRVTSVIGFPHGLSPVKSTEAAFAIAAGADELDVVVNYSAVKAGWWSTVAAELMAIVRLAKPRGITTKAILETCYLDRLEIVKLVRICKEAGFDFIKTSTGFGEKGATEDVVRLLVDIKGDMQVKASGGIRTYDDACKYLDLGCKRIGSSDFFGLLPE